MLLVFVSLLSDVISVWIAFPDVVSVWTIFECLIPLGLGLLVISILPSYCGLKWWSTFWVCAQCSVDLFRRFGRTYCFHFQIHKIIEHESMYKGIIWNREHLETFTILDLVLCMCVYVCVCVSVFCLLVCYQRKWGLKRFVCCFVWV